MRCGFCDCFGPFLSNRKKNNLDAPLDQNALNRCLELVQAHEARHDNLLKSSEHHRPLISTVYETCIPYRNTTVHPPEQPPYNRNYWLGTPPPSYRLAMQYRTVTRGVNYLNNLILIKKTKGSKLFPKKKNNKNKYKAERYEVISVFVEIFLKPSA
uniref:Uncharacterized protein n=1 Tax=Onchocerca volvulus TaxID=6282 RepID=A0A8R1TIV9_ONCVO